MNMFRKIYSLIGYEEMSVQSWDKNLHGPLLHFKNQESCTTYNFYIIVIGVDQMLKWEVKVFQLLQWKKWFWPKIFLVMRKAFIYPSSFYTLINTFPLILDQQNFTINIKLHIFCYVSSAKKQVFDFTNSLAWLTSHFGCTKYFKLESKVIKYEGCPAVFWLE